ncbi:hypothetical protein RHMOL_Rhmol01G0245900 [Rhododendron molle]|uniref:Uncharacterized protein n=1 Tax=Rhododendron molle TaxID=49168 RepID=A0ACC0Q5B0_RHOML|nr:hypothetical protein RHMOL_Rhmol01G0245900 [Rhododendron molle]
MATRNPNVEIPVPPADQWKRTPYFQTVGDPFWALAGAYPIEGVPMADATFFTAPMDLGQAELINPSSVLRFRIERRDFPFVECRFGGPSFSTH